MYGLRRLAFAADANAAKQDRVADRIVEHLKVSGEQKKADLLSAGIAGLTEKTFTKTMAKASDDGRVRIDIGEKNAKLYSATATP